MAPLLSRFAERLLNPRRRVDYALALALAASPVLYSLIIGAAFNVSGSDGTVFYGYLQRANFASLLVLLPVALFLMRRGIQNVVPVFESWPAERVPPVISLVGAEGRQAAYEGLRRAVLSPWVIGSALLTDGLIHLIDLGPFLVFYAKAFAGVPAAELSQISGAWTRDWSFLFLLSPAAQGQAAPSVLANFVLVILAYSVQFAIVLIALLFFFVAFRHNLYFLQRIFQRRWAKRGQEAASSIVVNLDDGDQCFGFRPANQAFNAQVASLALCGLIMLVSRFVHVAGVANVANPGDLPQSLGQLSFGLLFPTAGQIMLALGWVAALGVVSMPVLVKLLPQVPLGGPALPETTVVSYLREFHPEDRWPFPDELTAEEVAYVSSRFADNAFWPTGNNRAARLFFQAVLVFLVLVAPIARPEFSVMFFSWLALFAAAAAGLTTLTLWALRWSLAGIDERLVRRPATPAPVPESMSSARKRGRIRHNVFLSYRRADSRAYAGRLQDALKPSLRAPARLFMDIESIAMGEDFVTAIHRAIEASQVQLVLIGRSWLQIEDQHGKRRIDDPADLVRCEVQAGLESGLKVIPVLVDGARMPTEAELPAELAALARRNAHEMSDTRWEHDIERLIKAIEEGPAVAARASSG